MARGREREREREKGTHKREGKERARITIRREVGERRIERRKGKGG